jgi:endonuclease-3
VNFLSISKSNSSNSNSSNVTCVVSSNLKNLSKLVLSELKKAYPSLPKVFLAFEKNNNAQLLCAVMLSAQSTDAQIDKITSKLFLKYKTEKDFASANLKEFEKEIFSAGYYHSKAKNILSAFKKIVLDFNGKIPLTMDELISLPGVGRKTANIILTANGINSGIAVDTHVFRVSKRIGFEEPFRAQLTKAKNPDKVEEILMNVFPKSEWPNINRLLISHGRKYCFARNPDCKNCFLSKKNLCNKIGIQ